MLYKNKVGKKFVNCIDENLKQFAETRIYEQPLMKVTPDFFHLVVPCLKSFTDGSGTKIFDRLLQLRCEGHLTPRIHFVGPLKNVEIDEMKQFKNFMETEKVSDAIKCLKGDLSISIT